MNNRSEYVKELEYGIRIRDKALKSIYRTLAIAGIVILIEHVITILIAVNL